MPFHLPPIRSSVKLGIKLPLIAYAPFAFTTGGVVFTLAWLSGLPPGLQKELWRQTSLRNLVMLLVTAGLFFGWLLSFLFVRRIYKRLRSLSERASGSAILRSSDLPPAGGDEIARLDRLFSSIALRLLEAVRREQVAIAYAADVVLAVKPDGAIKSANAALTARYGWAADDIAGKSVFDLVLPQDWQPLRESIKSVQRSQFEARLLDRQGQPAASLWSISWSSSEQAAIAIIHDISERKQLEEMLAGSEKRTRAMMEKMPAGLILLSDEGDIRFANAEASRIIGKEREVLVGTKFISWLSEPAFESSKTLIELLLQRHHSVVAGIRSSGAQTVRVELRLNRLGRENNRDLLLLVMLDCTERFQFEELRQRLIAVIAHDIATPLATVHNSLSMANSGMLGELEPILQYKVKNAEEDCARILSMFKDMVRFQKLAADFSSLPAGQLPVKELTRQALDVISDQIEEKDLVIVEDECVNDVAAIGDADKLALLGARLMQLIADACKSGTSITTSARAEGALAYWSLIVEGDPEIAQRLERFLADTDVFAIDKDEGCDLELTLWRLLLYQCGAKLSLSQSAETIGCTITLSLPSLSSASTLAAVDTTHV